MRGKLASLACRSRPAGRGGEAADAFALPCAWPWRPRCHLAACRARAAAAANSLRRPHNHRTAACVVAAVDCRRRPALGRRRVARGTAFRDGQVGTHAVDVAGHASSGAGQRPARIQVGSVTRRSGFRRSTNDDGRSLLAALFGESWVDSPGRASRSDPRARGRQPAFFRGDRSRPYRSRCVDARGPAMADCSRRSRNRHSRHNPGNVACSRRPVAPRGAPVGPGSRGNRPALRCHTSENHYSRPRPARSRLRTALRCGNHRGSCRIGLGLVAKLPLYANIAAGRDLPESCSCNAGPTSTGGSVLPWSNCAATSRNGSRIWPCSVIISHRVPSERGARNTCRRRAIALA